jgi:hypothetical protein
MMIEEAATTVADFKRSSAGREASNQRRLDAELFMIVFLREGRPRGRCGWMSSFS